LTSEVIKQIIPAEAIKQIIRDSCLVVIVLEKEMVNGVLSPSVEKKLLPSLPQTTLLLIGIISLVLVFGILPVFASGRNQDEEEHPKVPSNWGPFQVEGEVGVSALFVDVNGSQQQYRSHYNYMPAFNLSDFSLNLAADGQGLSWMDYFQVNGNGFGDAYPYQRADLVFGKRARYEFKASFRKQEYFFSLPSYALGSHGSDSARRVTDIGLRLFPHRRVTLDFGYLRNYDYGTNFTSDWEFQNVYELTDPKRSLTQDFRVGVSLDLGALQASVIQNFRKFKDDPEQTENRELDSNSILPVVDASLPVRLSIPSTMFLARLAPSDRWSLEGKYRYSDGHVESGRSEFIALNLAEGMTLEENLTTASVSDRPEHFATLTGSVSLSDNVVFSNTFEIRRFDIDSQLTGSTFFGGPGPATWTFPSEATQVYEFRAIRNRPELEVFLHRNFSVFGGHQYVDRLVDEVGVDLLESHSHRQVAISNAGFGGFSLRPYSGARLSLQVEKGTANDGFTRTEPTDYTRWRVSSQLPLNTDLSVSPHLVISDRSNDVQSANYDADQRQVGFTVSYHPADSGFRVDGGYSLFHLDTIADIRFYLAGQTMDGFSDYRTQLHFLHGRGYIPLCSRVSLRMGYQFMRDPEDSSFALTRHQGDLGIEIPLPNGWMWEMGWYHISYNETFRHVHDYAANRLALTLRWGF
jgi:hypothetical protein